MATSVTGVSNHFPSAENGFTTTLASTIAAGATTVPLNSIAGYANGEVAVFVVDPSDATKKQTFTGTIDTAGIQVTGVVWTAGTNQAHSGGATVVDYATATHISMMTKGILVHADQDGTLKAGAVDNAAVLASDVVTTPKILDANVTTAKIADNAVTTAKIADGSVTPAKMLGVDIFSYQNSISGTAPVAGTGQFYMQAGTSVITTNASGDGTVTFSTAFPAGLLTVVACDGDDGTNVNFSILAGSNQSAFNFSSNKVSTNLRVNWIAIGF